jgi:tetratricopeptide (TPR) repeat protein
MRSIEVYMKRSFILSAVIALSPLAAFAQAGTDAGAYVPPQVKLVDTGLLSTGSGTVVVKVLVQADGAAYVQGIASSTNHDLDKGALDIARRSTYKAATKGGVPIVSLYEVTLHFTGNGLSRYETIIGSGAYGRAKRELQVYLGKHPDDARAQLDLGLAESFTGDDAGAVAAFEKAGSIPEKFKDIAAKAYGTRAVALLKEQKYADALVLAKKAAALRPGYQAYDNLGLAELKTGDTASAAADFEKARALAATGKAPANLRATISANLAAVYAAKGNLGQAKAYAAEAQQIDPSMVEGYAALRNAYADQAAAALKDSRYADAAALYEQAAAVSPSDKAMLYSNAAFAYLQQKPKAANDKAKADADKALSIDAHSAGANYAAGIATANQGKRREALAYLNAADAAAKAGTDTALTENIEKTIEQLNGSGKKRK